jgi:polyferredoxin
MNTPPLYHAKRRTTQVVMLLALALIPLLGIFRIDLQAGNFVILGRQVWWSDVFLMQGFWIMLATAAAMTYSTVGTVYCGWACPQNSLSELTDALTFRLLGKRAKIAIESGESKVAAAKNTPLNWALLGGAILVISMALAVIPFLYLYPPGAVYSLVTFAPDERLPRFAYYLYGVFTFAIFLDIALIRNVLCSYFCLYRIWQHIFKTRQTLHVGYDASRKAECAKCSYCEATCFLGFNPTQFKVYDSCINCGECVDVCNKLHAPENTRGLLQFEYGEKKTGTLRDSVDDLLSRLSWAGALFVIGAGLFAWGYLNYAPYNLVAYRSDRSSGAEVNDYRIQVSNKVYTPGRVDLSIDGIPPEDYKLDTPDVALAPAGQANVNLHVANLSKGLHRIIVKARAASGWTDRFVIEHYSSGPGGKSPP